MYVSASTDCFPEDNLDQAIQKLLDLEFSCVEIAIRESGRQMKPSEVLADLEGAVQNCRNTYRLTPVAYTVEIEADGQTYYDQFAAICKLAKATKVVAVSVPSAELGTPFNAEVERLREMVRIATLEGVNVGIRNQTGRMAEDPETALVLCDNVKGLGITLDPGEHVSGPHRDKPLDPLMKHVYNIWLRDAGKDNPQVRFGQGDVEYSRLMAQLGKVNYRRALCVHLTELEDLDHMAEMRKMRLFLESLLT